MKFFGLILFITLLLNVVGCADIKTPKPKDLLNPFALMPTIGRGDTKEQVIGRWGKPDQINELGVDELGVIKEEWVYNARYTAVPIDYQYTSKTKYLYFEGNILVNKKEKPVAKKKQEPLVK